MHAILYKNTSDNRVLNKSITLVKEVDEKLEKYDITSSSIQIESFTDRLSVVSSHIWDPPIEAAFSLHGILVS